MPTSCRKIRVVCRLFRLWQPFRDGREAEVSSFSPLPKPGKREMRARKRDWRGGKTGRFPTTLTSQKFRRPLDKPKQRMIRIVVNFPKCGRVWVKVKGLKEELRRRANLDHISMTIHATSFFCFYFLPDWKSGRGHKFGRSALWFGESSIFYFFFFLGNVCKLRKMKPREELSRT